MNHLLVNSIMDYFTKEISKYTKPKGTRNRATFYYKSGESDPSNDFHFDISTASEAVYDDYYKLKKRYEAENREKSDALTRVDQVKYIVRSLHKYLK